MSLLHGFDTFAAQATRCHSRCGFGSGRHSRRLHQLCGVQFNRRVLDDGGGALLTGGDGGGRGSLSPAANLDVLLLGSLFLGLQLAPVLFQLVVVLRAGDAEKPRQFLAEKIAIAERL